MALPELVGLLDGGGDGAAYDELVRLLAREFESRSAGKRYFPVSRLRESWRRLLQDAAPIRTKRLVFYRAFSDALLLAMASSPEPEIARAGRILRGLLASPHELLLRLHYLAGLDWDEIGELPGAREQIGDPGKAALELAAELDRRGFSPGLLEKHHLRARGAVTQLLEDVRDGRRPLGDVVAREEARLHRQAAHLLHLEAGHISWQAADLVNEMFLRLPRDPAKAPANHMEFEALTRRIMRHVLIDRARRPVPGQGKTAAELSDKLLSPPAAEDRVFWAELVRVVEDVLEEMRRTDPETAEMGRAMLFGGADQRELARLHSVSVSTVKRRIKDARDRIRERLGLE